MVRKSKMQGDRLAALRVQALQALEQGHSDLAGWTGSPAELAEWLEDRANTLMALSEEASDIAMRDRHH
ncbi:hypothetical protein [Aureimonas frigidaquae]|uniref:hypothetical protein n=1 Tax=Aureimonas frigidaquae TaxID=424757 RepID=UPI000AD29483|nr:hypothetical protein [Aureimonas frigidaquae]